MTGVLKRAGARNDRVMRVETRNGGTNAKSKGRGTKSWLKHEVMVEKQVSVEALAKG